jgi:EAL domain-containing protein (putative c-di-GMP-specific phosphodiesterase class I)
VRLIDAEGDVIPPDRFVPAAERFGILHRIDHAVLYTVVGHMRDHPDLRASVNISARTLTSERLPGIVTGLLEASRVDPKRIYFEITETTMIQNMEQARKNMRELQDYGCRFALDDFGKGVSSLGYLRDLPVDIIKIDGKFIQDIDQDEINQTMVRAINEIAHALGRKTVAEYVCNGGVLETVRQLGVDYVQVWHICRPAPLEAFLEQGLGNVKVPAA